MGIGLPVIVDIAISLIFVYFTLSLLSSEVQELLKALLQWKAVHLKESIEGLLVGNDSAQLTEARKLANQLYDNPLIRSLNQSAKDTIASKLTPKVTNVFGDKSSGPSEISAKTFSATLLDTFDFVGIYRKLIAHRLELRIKSFIPNPGDYDARLKDEMEPILEAFKAKRISLDETVKKLAEEAREDEDIFDPDAFQRCFSCTEAVQRFTAKMQISLADVIRMVRFCLDLKDNPAFQEMLKTLGDNPSFEQVRDGLQHLRQENPAIDQEVPKTIDQAILIIALLFTSPTLKGDLDKLPPIPPVLFDNLEKLADSALLKVNSMAQEVSQFEQEVETWFDRSMERAQGVYRRNSKLIAIIIALIIAIVANADTFYMVDRFSKEGAIQAAVVQAVGGLSEEQLQQPDTINQISANITLPIGWDAEILASQKNATFSFLKPLPFWLQRIPGWIVTGIAISMGSSFWYQLLRKFIDIRNVGQDSSKTAPAPAPQPVILAPQPYPPSKSEAT
jgi:hypothetical protein